MDWLRQSLCLLSRDENMDFPLTSKNTCAILIKLSQAEIIATRENEWTSEYWRQSCILYSAQGNCGCLKAVGNQWLRQFQPVAVLFMVSGHPPGWCHRAGLSFEIR